MELLSVSATKSRIFHAKTALRRSLRPKVSRWISLATGQGFPCLARQGIFITRVSVSYGTFTNRQAARTKPKTASHEDKQRGRIALIWVERGLLVAGLVLASVFGAARIERPSSRSARGAREVCGAGSTVGRPRGRG